MEKTMEERIAELEGINRFAGDGDNDARLRCIERKLKEINEVTNKLAFLEKKLGFKFMQREGYWTESEMQITKTSKVENNPNV